MQKISNAPLSSYYFDNNLINSLESLPYWSDYSAPDDKIYLLVVKQIEILKGKDFEKC